MPYRYYGTVECPHGPCPCLNVFNDYECFISTYLCYRYPPTLICFSCTFPEPVSNRELTNGAIVYNRSTSAPNPTKSSSIDAYEMTSEVATSRTARLTKDGPLVSIIPLDGDSYLSQRENNSEVVERLTAVTENSLKNKLRLGLIRKPQTRQDLPQNNQTPPCEPKAVRAHLKWYHIALISVAAQTFVIALLIGVCVAWKRRHHRNKTDDCANKVSATKKNTKDKQSTESGKT